MSYQNGQLLRIRKARGHRRALNGREEENSAQDLNCASEALAMHNIEHKLLSRQWVLAHSPPEDTLCPALDYISFSTCQLGHHQKRYPAKAFPLFAMQSQDPDVNLAGQEHSEDAPANITSSDHVSTDVLSAGVPEEDARSEKSWEVISQTCDSERECGADPPPSPALSTVLSEGELAGEGFAFSSADEGHSDAETHLTDDLLRGGEPDLCASTFDPTAAAAATPAKPASTTGKRQGSARLESVAEGSSPRASSKVAVIARSAGDSAGHLVATIAQGLRALVARVRNYVAHHQPAVHTVAQWVSETVQELARSLQVCLVPGSKVSGLSVTAADISAAAALRLRAISAQAKKGLTAQAGRDIDWAKTALAVGCSALAAMLYRSTAANAKLAARLGQREGELAELVARIVALQRSMTSHRVPIIRHTTYTMAPSGWPIVVQAI